MSHLRRKYQIPTSHNIKKTLDLNEIKKIFEYLPSLKSSPAEVMAVDFWKLSYLCNGMNMKDIACLKYKNIDGEFIKFKRQKTKETSRGQRKLYSTCLSFAK